MTHATRRLFPRSLSVIGAAALVLAIVTPAAADPGAGAQAAAGAAGATSARAASVTPQAFDPAAFSLTLTPFRTGLRQPVFATNAGDGTNRVYVVEKGGRIKVLSAGGGYLGTLLDISDRISTGSEQGLLGLAFHPDYASNHRYYVNYTERDGDTVIVEYHSSSDGLRTLGGRRLIVLAQPFSNHNGGMLAFGKDGFLYIGMGDGGSAGDPGNRAQSLNSPLGKILRMDVDHPTAGRPYGIPATNPYRSRPGLDLIWSRGLRNPWRWSFDRETGDIWIGDVGQNTYEEVDHYPLTSNGPGYAANYGWRQIEGRHCYRPRSGCSTSGKVMPLVEYTHAGHNCSVIGGYVYRGSDFPALVGGYVYADLCSRHIWVVSATASTPATPTFKRDAPGSPSSFGETEDGELFLVTLNGGVYKVGAS